MGNGKTFPPSQLDTAGETCWNRSARESSLSWSIIFSSSVRAIVRFGWSTLDVKQVSSVSVWPSRIFCVLFLLFCFCFLVLPVRPLRPRSTWLSSRVCDSLWLDGQFSKLKIAQKFARSSWRRQDELFSTLHRQGCALEKWKPHLGAALSNVVRFSVNVKLLLIVYRSHFSIGAERRWCKTFIIIVISISALCSQPFSWFVAVNVYVCVYICVCAHSIRMYMSSMNFSRFDVWRLYSSLR